MKNQGQAINDLKMSGVSFLRNDTPPWEGEDGIVSQLLLIHGRLRNAIPPYFKTVSGFIDRDGIRS